MIPNPLLMSTPRHPNDRLSLELRAYARYEWGNDALWLRGLARRRSPIHAWAERLRQRSRAKKAARAAGHAEVRGSPGVEPIVWDSGRDCPHDAYEDLGFGNSAQFLRCVLCGAVLIAHGNRWWALESARQPLRVEFVER